MLDKDIYNRWISMSKKTLESAYGDYERGDYNWCCFKCHQAAKYALKALLQGVCKEAHGHSLLRLLSKIFNEFSLSREEDIYQACVTLDKYYILTRYVDAWVKVFLTSTTQNRIVNKQ